MNLPGGTLFSRILGATIGGAGGALCAGLGLAPAGGGAVAGVCFGAAFGLAFAVLARERATTPGAGLLWAAASAFLLWLAGPLGVFAHFAPAARPMGMAESAREHFPELVAYLLILGAPLGLALGALAKPAVNRGTLPFSLGRALTAGGLGGIVGGWAFSQWMAKAGFFPLIAGLVGSRSAPVGLTLHFVFAVVIGATFGLLFQRDVRGLGSSMGWGLAYGIVWWFLGPLTILPLWQGNPVDWSAAAGARLFGSFVGHVVYGLLLGVVYAVLDKGWVAFFVESDPIRRQPEGVGARGLFSALWGGGAGLAGGLVCWPLVAQAGGLPRLAALVGGDAAALGSAVHLVVAVLIGAGYGVLFARESPDFGVGIAWGLVYGVIWWFVGTLTLLPIWSGTSFTWTVGAASAALPSLVGHLVYGGTLSVVFLGLERWHLRRLSLDGRQARREDMLRRPPGTPAPAVSLLVVGLGVTLLIVL